MCVLINTHKECGPPFRKKGEGSACFKNCGPLFVGTKKIYRGGGGPNKKSFFPQEGVVVVFFPPRKEVWRNFKPPFKQEGAPFGGRV